MKRLTLFAAALVGVIALALLTGHDAIAAGAGLTMMPLVAGAALDFYDRRLIDARFQSSPLFGAFNDAGPVTIESLNDRLIELNEQARNIQARADAEQRLLSEDEDTEIKRIFVSFESTEQEIERRKQVETMNARIGDPKPRKAAPEANLPTEGDDDDPAAATAAARARDPKPRSSVYAQPRDTDRGKWGFRSQAEFLVSVIKGSAKGGTVDPRLIANAPATYGSEGVGSDGGFAVPPDFRTTIVQKLFGEDSLIGMTDQQTSSSNQITFPADETSPWQTTGGIQAYWESEGGQKQQSKPQLTEKTVRLNKVIALVPVTDELLDDAPAMASYINTKAPQKIDFKINDALINGNGVGKPVGILTSPGTIVVAEESAQTAGTVVFANIQKLRSALTPVARKNAVWVMNPDAEDALMGLQFPGTGTAVPVFLPPGGLRDSPNSTLFGRPIVTSEACPPLGTSGDIIFGDWTSYLSVVKAAGIRQDVSIHIFFDYDITAFRFVLRVGGMPWWNQTIQPFQAGSSVRGFFAVLATRS